MNKFKKRKLNSVDVGKPFEVAGYFHDLFCVDDTDTQAWYHPDFYFYDEINDRISFKIGLEVDKIWEPAYYLIKYKLRKNKNEKKKA